MHARTLLVSALAGLVLAAPAHARNPQIAGLQVALRAEGFYCGPIDGVAGPATAAAVRTIQRRSHLPVTGIVDARTRVALGPLGHPLLGSRAIGRGAVGLDVSVLQFLLLQRKLSPGPLDGVFDARTERAFRRFQRAARLTPDGIAGPASLAVLARSGAPIVVAATPPARKRAATARYLVRAGDSLSALAAAHGTTAAALARLNGLEPSALLLVGEHLRVPVTAGKLAQSTTRTVRYIVRPGDSLSAIAAAHRVSTDALARLNALRPTALLVIGATLRVPAPAAGAPPALRTMRYRVRAGDSLSAIAAAYRTTVRTLAHLNGLQPADILQAGAVIHVPARLPSRSALPTRTEAASSLALSAQQVRASIDRWAGVYGVDTHLARALAWMESGYHTNLTSVSGAWGVMQILPQTWDFVETVIIGEKVPRTADGDVRIGVAYIDHLLKIFNGDERLAVAAWYEGAKAVQESGLLPETKTFVANVLALRDRM